jgi:energy-coupling factor transporter ATP-binding protein EcfA2
MLLKLILENYIPLLGKGIHRVELDTHEMINLFISQNGTGKTSILKELNMLPPENGNYKAGGRKYVERKVGNKHFVLDSYTGMGNGHSFKLNGKELNTGGTYTSQKELVESYFRLDPGLNRVLSGLRVTDLLSGMSAARRKDVFMQLYPNNTDYALDVFNKLRQERNDLKGAIKNQINRYTEENRKLTTITECGVEELENRIKLLDGELRQCLLVRGSLDGVTLDRRVNDHIQEFTQLTDKLTVNKLSGFIFTRHELEAAIETHNNLMSLHQDQALVLKGAIAENASVLEGLEEFLADPEVFKSQAKQINEELVEINEQLEQHDLLLKAYPVFNDPEADFANIEVIHETLRSYLYRVTLASDPSVTGAGYKDWLREQEQLTNQIRQAKQTASDMTHQLKHYERAEVVECPDCTHKFKIGITPQDIANLKGRRDALNKNIERMEERLKNLVAKIENDSDWYMSMNQLYMFVRENGHVKILPQLIREYEIGKAETNRLLNALQGYVERSKLKSHKAELLKEQNLLETRIGLLDRNNVLFVASYVEGLERELHEENNKVSYYRGKVESMKRQLAAILSYDTDLETLRRLREEIMKGLANQGKYEFRQKVDDRIMMLTSEKEDYMTSIIKNRSLTAVVNSISEDIERMKRRLLIVEICQDGLCPNKGVIGKLMGDFIKAVCANMNAVLKAVWNTTLFIKPCAKANGDLTYKFPVVVGEGDPNPDVTDCSAGERDLIDWTFRFVMLNYYPDEYPLIMDEVGVNLDEINRGRFFNYVQDYTRSKSHKQLFIVSHYIAQYGIFDNPNIIGLRYEGLTMPGEVNRNSVIA